MPFRHSETPCFLPGSLIDKMARYGREMVEQLLANPQYQRGFARRDSARVSRAQRRRRARYSCRRISDSTRNCEPQLVEIQGFPTLYAYQPLLAESLPRGVRNRRRA